jgi:pimeloyl-ACP methyl ester carboxylesterase
MYKIKIILIFMALFLSLYVFFACQKRPENSVKSADGVHVVYETQGQGKPVLVFVHGWSCDMSYWKAQVPHFTQKHQVVTLDLAGHGQSGLGRKDWTIETFGNDVRAVIEYLELDSVILIGHSMGGSVTVETARHIPERIVGLIGVDTFQNFEDAPSIQEIENFLVPIREDFQEATKNFVHRVLFTPDADSALAEGVAADMASAPREVGLSALENAWTYDIKDALKDMRLPIRCINSDFYPVNIQVNKKYASSYDVKFMSGVGHFPMMEDPDTFNRLLEETIEELIGGVQGESK